MTLSVKMLKIDEDFNKKGAKQVLVGSSDIPPGNSTKKNQNLRKNFFLIFSPPAIPTLGLFIPPDRVQTPLPGTL